LAEGQQKLKFLKVSIKSLQKIKRLTKPQIFNIFEVDYSS